MCPYLHTAFNRVSGKASLRCNGAKKTEEGKEAGDPGKWRCAYVPGKEIASARILR